MATATRAPQRTTPTYAEARKKIARQCASLTRKLPDSLIQVSIQVTIDIGPDDNLIYHLIELQSSDYRTTWRSFTRLPDVYEYAERLAHSYPRVP